MSKRREEKALLEFKHIMDDVVRLLQKATDSETVYFYWVNHTRRQFVLETKSTSLPNVMFQDRIQFEQLYLNDYKDITAIEQLKIGVDVSPESLRHYYDFVPVKYATLIPFINNGETVAITVVETETPLIVGEFEDIFSAYKNALLNVLNTYLELTDLYENQQEWNDYDQSLEQLSPKQHKVDVLDTLIEEMQKIIPGGGVAVLARGMETWTTVLRSNDAPDWPALGLMMEEKSMVYDALQKGEARFAIHFNQNPRRISTSELNTEGATLAIPLMISDRRHAVILAYHHNALVFKESTKHQLKNLVRIASLAIQVNTGSLPVQQDLFTSEYGSFIPELWEKALQKQINKSGNSEEKTWFGFITIQNLPQLRSRLRLEDLKRLQRTLVTVMNPSRSGFNGYIGFNTDYIFAYLLTGRSAGIHEEWYTALHQVLEKPIELNDGQQIEIEVQVGSMKIDSSYRQVHDVITAAKKELSEEVKKKSSGTNG